MMGVVVDGIPTYLLDVQSYGLGGKTGTANIVTGEGSYKPDAYISSFVGVAPLENPVLAVLVKIDEPKDVPWGPVVAAPDSGPNGQTPRRVPARAGRLRAARTRHPSGRRDGQRGQDHLQGAGRRRAGPPLPGA